MSGLLFDPASDLAVLNGFALLAGRPGREPVPLATEGADFRILVPASEEGGGFLKRWRRRSSEEKANP